MIKKAFPLKNVTEIPIEGYSISPSLFIYSGQSGRQLPKTKLRGHYFSNVVIKKRGKISSYPG